MLAFGRTLIYVVEIEIEIEIYSPYVRVYFWRTYVPYIRAVQQKPRPITIDINILCGTVGDITQRHSLRATGSICHCIFFVERLRPILQVLCSDPYIRMSKMHP